MINGKPPGIYMLGYAGRGDNFAREQVLPAVAGSEIEAVPDNLDAL